MAERTVTGLGDARILRAPPELELSSAPRPEAGARRRYAPRLSTALELCVRRGGPTRPILNGRPVEMAEHGVAVVTPGTVWQSESLNAYWAIAVRGDYLERAYGDLGADPTAEWPAFLPSDPGKDAEAAFLTAFATLAAQPGPLAAEEALQSLFQRLRPALSRHSLTPQRVRSRAGRAVARVREALDARPEASWDTDRLLDAAGPGWSRHQLYRAFQVELGMPPSRYLEAVRLARARDLLAEGLEVVEAAVRTGFYDGPHLSRAFLRRFGTRPGRYRLAKGPLLPTPR